MKTENGDDCLTRSGKYTIDRHTALVEFRIRNRMTVLAAFYFYRRTEEVKLTRAPIGFTGSASHRAYARLLRLIFL